MDSWAHWSRYDASIITKSKNWHKKMTNSCFFFSCCCFVLFCFRFWHIWHVDHLEYSPLFPNSSRPYQSKTTLRLIICISCYDWWVVQRNLTLFTYRCIKILHCKWLDGLLFSQVGIINEGETSVRETVFGSLNRGWPPKRGSFNRGLAVRGSYQELQKIFA